MSSTLVAVIVAMGLVLPGFIVADLAEAGRASRARQSDWELVLRALTYALVLHTLVFVLGWTPQVLEDLDLTGVRQGPAPWVGHGEAIALYVGVVLVGGPTLFGMALSRLLRRAEARGQLNAMHHALGGRDARDAWDFAFQRFGSGFVLVHLKPGVEQRSPFLVAKWGLSSWATQTPAETKDVFFEEIWPSDAHGQISEEYAQPRGMWVSIDQVDALYFIDPPKPATHWRRRAVTHARGGLQALASGEKMRNLRRRLARRIDPNGYTRRDG